MPKLSPETLSKRNASLERSRYMVFKNKITELEIQNDYLLYNLNSKSEEIERLRNLVWLYQSGIIKKPEVNTELD